MVCVILWRFWHASHEITYSVNIAPWYHEDETTQTLCRGHTETSHSFYLSGMALLKCLEHLFPCSTVGIYWLPDCKISLSQRLIVKLPSGLISIRSLTQDSVCQGQCRDIQSIKHHKGQRWSHDGYRTQGNRTAWHNSLRVVPRTGASACATAFYY